MKQKKKYKKTKLKKETKRFILILIVLIAIIIILNGVKKSLEEKSYLEKNTYNSEYSSIKEILENYGCTYIKEVKSKDKNFSSDIYLKFKYNTFEENESKERFYKNVIGNIVKFLNNNFRLIDEAKNLTIEVFKNGNMYGYVINGDDDYFANIKSENSLKNYTEDKISAVQINSSILSELIKDNWNASNIQFGTKDSIFENYEIYFDEGIEVRKISKKVYNIIFNNKYNSNVVNDIKPGTSINEIVSKIGNPTFGSKEEKIIGYKTKDLYIFFLENEISIYRNEQVDTKEFEGLVEKYANKEIEIKKFMNELTYIWEDYSEYNYSENFIDLVYPLKGVKINMNNDSSKNIQIYNNYPNIDGIEKLIKENKITGRLDENLVYIEEISRMAKKDELLYTCDLYKEGNSISIESNLYGYYIDNNKINFVSKDGTNPNITISDDINTGFWYKDTIFIYSIKNKGIFLYDLNNKSKTTLLKGEEEYTFEKYENNILTYDKGKTIQISN